MPLLLTCDCGARTEIAHLPTGQEVKCPACLQALATRDKPALAPRTSWLALLSLAVAVLGALTVVGSLAGALLGLAALARIRRRPADLAGSSYALAGVVVGLGATLLTAVLVSQRDRLPVAAWARQRAMAGQLDPAPAREVTSADGILVLTPTADWLHVKRGTSGDPAVDDIQQSPEGLFADVHRHAYLEVRTDRHGDQEPAIYVSQLYADLRPQRKPLLGDDDDRDDPMRETAAGFRRVKDQALAPIDGYAGHEWVVDSTRGGQWWRFVVRAYCRPRDKDGRTGPRYLVRLYAPRHQFAAHEEEFRSLLDTTRFAP